MSDTRRCDHGYEIGESADAGLPPGAAAPPTESWTLRQLRARFQEYRSLGAPDIEKLFALAASAALPPEVLAAKLYSAYVERETSVDEFGDFTTAIAVRWLRVANEALRASVPADQPRDNP